jgi:hypothetical protein
MIHSPNTASDRPYALARWLLLLAVALFGIANCALLPPFEEYDSIQYWSGIQQVADTGTIPLLGQAQIATDVDNYSGPRTFDQQGADHRFIGKIYRDFFARADAALPDPGPRRFAPGPIPNYEGQQPPLYFVALAPVYRLVSDWPWPSHMLVLRLVSWALAFIGFAAGTLAGARALRDMGCAPALSLLLPAWPFLFPEFFADMARIGNNGTCLFFAGVAWALTLRQLRQPDWRGVAGLGLTLGLGLLTKAFFIPIAAGLALLFLYQALRVRSLRPVIDIAVSLVIAGAIGGGWYLHNWLTTGSFTNLVDFGSMEQQGGMLALIQAQGIQLHHLLHFLRGMAVMAVTFVWAGTWSRAILWPVLAAPILLMAAIAFVSWLVRLPRLPIAGQAALFFVGPFVAGLVYHQVVWVYIGAGEMAGTPGWHLHIAAPALALALALGWRWRRVLAILAVYAILFHAACWASEASFFSGCAYTAAAREPLRLDPGSCLIDLGHLSILSEPMLAGAALLLGTAAAAAAVYLAWRGPSRQEP